MNDPAATSYEGADATITVESGALCTAPPPGYNAWDGYSGWTMLADSPHDPDGQGYVQSGYLKSLASGQNYNKQVHFAESNIHGISGAQIDVYGTVVPDGHVDRYWSQYDTTTGFEHLNVDLHRFINTNWSIFSEWHKAPFLLEFSGEVHFDTVRMIGTSTAKMQANALKGQDYANSWMTPTYLSASNFCSPTSSCHTQALSSSAVTIWGS